MSRHQFMQGAIDQALAAACRAVDVLETAGPAASRASAAHRIMPSLLALAGDPQIATVDPAARKSPCQRRKTGPI